MKAVETHELTKRFGATLALDAVSLGVERGEIFGLVGPDGAGKSTAIRLLTAALQPTSGRALVAGYDVAREPEQVRARVGYVAQHFAIYGDLTVAENLAFLAQIRDLPPTRIAETITLLRLEENADRPARTLSGGTLQRLGLAQALLADPPILVLDEPTVSLDPPSVAAFKALLRDLRAAGKTVLLASHILSDVQELADRVAILDLGRLVAIDSVAGLARRCEMPEQLWIDLAEVSGNEAALARRAGAAVAELRGAALHIAVPRERKLAVMRALLAEGVAMRDFHSVAPTLDAIFSRLISHVPAPDS